MFILDIFFAIPCNNKYVHFPYSEYNALGKKITLDIRKFTLSHKSRTRSPAAANSEQFMPFYDTSSKIRINENAD